MSLQELLELRTRSIEEVFESIRAMNEEIGNGFDIDVQSAGAQHLKASLLEIVEALRAFRQVLEASERVLEEIVRAEPTVDENNNLV